MLPWTLAMILPRGRKTSCGSPKVASEGTVAVLRDRVVRRREDRVGHVAGDEGRDLPARLDRGDGDRRRRSGSTGAELARVALDRADDAGEALLVAGEDRRVDDVAAELDVADLTGRDDPELSIPGWPRSSRSSASGPRACRPPCRSRSSGSVRGDDRDVVGLAADVEVRELVVGDDREVGRVAADPDEADLAGDPAGRVGKRGDDRPAGEACGGRLELGAAVDLVGLEQVDPAGDVKTTLFWVGELVACRWSRRRAAWALEMTLLTTMLVPIAYGNAQPDQELVVLAVLGGALGGVGPEEVGGVDPAEAERVDPVGDLDRGQRLRSPEVVRSRRCTPR